MNLFEKISGVWILAVLCIGLIRLLKVRRMYFEIKNQSKIPQALLNFKTHNASPLFYSETKNRVENFINSSLQDEIVEIILNEDDINSLYTKGISLNKYKPGTYLYFEFQENLILEKLVEWPNFFGPNGCRTRIRSISFDLENGKLVTKTKILEEYGRVMNEVEDSFSLSGSPLILFILGASHTPLFPSSLLFDTNSAQTIEYQRALKILEKLKNVKVENFCLTIQS
jgi:hypothetical protein